MKLPGRSVFPINKMRVSISPCSKILDSHSRIIFLIATGGTLAACPRSRFRFQATPSCPAPATPPHWPLPRGRGLREGHAWMSFVPHVSVLDAVLLICIMTGYMLPGACTKKTLPCPPVEIVRKPSFKAN